jgi:hypothetical protein
MIKGKKINIYIYMQMVHMPLERAGDPKKFRVKVGISLALSLFLLSDKYEEEEVEEEEEL